MSPRLQFALDIAYQAGRMTLGWFRNEPHITYKSDNTPVTIADKEAESLLRAAIRSTYPAEGILGEEEGESGSQAARWVIDPIDGTKSFICGVPLYATLLSFEEEGRPTLGVCYFPALDQMLYSEAGSGAYENGRKISVSKVKEPSQATLCCGSHASMEKFGKTSGLMRLASKARATRTWGDAYGHGLVATGRIEAMLDPTVRRWDISAMQLIVQEAGGKMTDFQGALNPQMEAVSSNGIIHNSILECFDR